jgi:hypothetical protein
MPGTKATRRGRLVRARMRLATVSGYLQSPALLIRYNRCAIDVEETVFCLEIGND